MNAAASLLRRRKGSRSLDLLLTWRTEYGFGRLETLVLSVYLVVLAYTIRYHEPWADEAQAWVIARDNSIWQILRYRLHYEGAPGLWHLILRLFQMAGGRYTGIDWLGGAFATAGIIVFLRWSPFPLLLRILLPFTFWLQYQYAVIARGYTLFALLAFSLSALFFKRQFLWFALTAGLLANISLQGAVYSFFLVGLYLFQHARQTDEKPVSGTGRVRALLQAGALYSALLAISALTAVPAPDCGIAGGAPVAGGLAAELLTHFPGPLPAGQDLPTFPPPADVTALIAPPGPPPLVPEPAAREPSFLHAPGAWAAWYVHHDELDATGRVLPKSFKRSSLETLLELLSLTTAPLATSRFLGCALVGVLIVWLWLRRSLRMILPWAANVVVGEALWIADHHTGLLFLSLITAVWLTVQAPRPAGRVFSTSQSAALKVVERSLVLLLVLLCVLQIRWTAVSIHHDVYESYDPGRETAAFLLQHPHTRMAAFDFVAVSVQPYFAANPFFNLRHSYWVWSTRDNPNGAYLATIAQRPDLVLFSEDMLAPGFMRNEWAPLSPVTARTQDRDLAFNPIILDLQAQGYRETHRFCGDRFMRLSASYRSCHLIFEPVAQL